MSNNLRISGGELRGIKINVKSNVVKPTSEIVRQSLFNIIDVRESKFLDVFSGSGIVGIEALSRGAAFVCFIEKNFSLALQIKQNLDRIKISNTRFKLIKNDWEKGFGILKKENTIFDVIFLDPFYDFKEYIKLIIQSKALLNTNGIIVLEMASKNIPIVFSSTEVNLDIRTYGDTSLLFINYNTAMSISNQNS